MNDEENNQLGNSIDLEIINAMYNTLNINDICKYHDINSYKLSIPSNDIEYINIIHVNARSLNKNYDQLTTLMQTLPKLPDVICISETWLTPLTAPFNVIEGFNCFYTHRPGGCGGAAIFVNSNLSSTQLNDYCISDDNIELCTVGLTHGQSKYIITSVYRHHDKHHKVNEFNAFIDEFLSQNIFTNNQTIITGDININLLEHDSHPPTNNFLTIMQSYNYFPHISRPTRFPDDNSNASPSLLDHIWTNFNAPFSSGILLYPLTDHLPVLLNISNLDKIHTKHKVCFRVKTNENRRKFKTKLSEIDWESLLNYQDINTNCSLFLDTIYTIYYSCFPIVTKHVSSKRLKNPWITQAITKSIQNKFNLYKSYKLGIITFEFYKKFRNNLNNIIKQAKKNYYLQRFSNFKLSTKKLWETINELSNTSPKKQDTTHSVIHNDVILDTPINISEAFNEYFTNIAPELANKLPPKVTTHDSYLSGNYPNSMAIPPVTTHETIKIISSISNKSVHINELPPNIIKENKETLSIPLTILFNQSINTGTFPEKFKIGKVIPIYKSGPKTDIANYRPISLLPMFSKIFEALMKKYLMSFLDTTNILNNRQFGFRSNLSTFDAINTFTSDLYTALNNNKSILSVFIDFRKAFDTIQPNILLDKMYHYGIRGCIHDWFSSYLTNRSQFTVFNNSSSTQREIALGVPQGSILGPILFLIYINDICNISKSLKTILFADDSTFYMIGDNPTEIIHSANVELQKFSEWCLANRLTVNTSKTYYILFTNIITKYQPLPNLLILNESIQQVYKTKFLGVVFDKGLTFKHHISELCLTLSKKIPLLLKVKHYAPLHILKCIYFAHIYPHLNYCNPIWSSTYATHLYHLNVLHKKIIRIMTDSDFCAHTQPLFKYLNILTLTDISNYNIASYMYKQVQTNQCDTQPVHSYNTRNQSSLQIPKHKLTLFTHSLLYLGRKTWNNIPNIIKQSSSLYSFKKSYKKYLISLYTQPT